MRGTEEEVSENVGEEGIQIFRVNNLDQGCTKPFQKRLDFVM